MCDHIGRHLGFLSSPSVMPIYAGSFKNYKQLPNILTHLVLRGGGVRIPKFLVLIVTLPLGFVRRNIPTKYQGIRQTAYNTLVRPQLEYAFPVWSLYTQANINKVEAVQRRAARWVTSDYSSYSSVTHMINSLGWRSLECLIMFYKIVYGLPITFSARSGWPGLGIQCISYRYKLLQITINTLSSLWPLYNGTISLPRLSCQMTWAYTGNHLQPKPHLAINPEKMFWWLF